VDNANKDSSAETLRHIKRVNALLINAATELLNRAKIHDDSKLEPFEKEGFDAVTDKLNGMTYGSDEYNQSLKELEVYLNHHYANNRHHPQHFPNGVNDMTLFDIIEMFFDWKASSERHADGNILRSIEHNEARFGITEQLSNIFRNTTKYLNW
jgi:hypothetical protein